MNLKSGRCPEDCAYCSQRLGSDVGILAYSWLPPDEAVRQASAGIRAGASRVCLVASGRGPSARDVDRVTASDDEVIDVIFALRDLGSESIPVNFLMPFDGTPLAGTYLLSPMRCLRILAMARLACPAAEIRMAGGREMHLRSLQPLALHLANSLFLGDYLTSEGQAAKADLAPSA